MKREGGVAAITAILIVAVAATTATLMLSQQSAMLDQASLVAARAQADLYARAGLDWSRGVLLQDQLTSGAYDGLDEGWAQPLAAMPVERAVVSGAIEDEQGKLNLNNLVVNNVKNDAAVKAFRQLLASLGLAPELADAVVDWIDADSDLSGPGGAEDAYYLSLAKPYRAANSPMVQVEELYRVRGFDAATVAKLKPYVTALHDAGTNQMTVAIPVNVNTASPLVLAALMPDMPQGKIDAFVAARTKQPMKTLKQLEDWTHGLANGTNGLHIQSSYFSVRIRVAQDDVQLASDALLVRKGSTVSVAWRRPIY
ncbi:MAG TPA: type II secretion system minor pseudopilin GspK [Usitatibacter sp.]|nr:type II secretion system minor pseudopilin GspK [Usitatibacter sp.]